jgi:hypothetical protein
MVYFIIIGVTLVAILSPAIIGVLLRLVTPKTHIDTLSISIGVIFVIAMAIGSDGEYAVLSLVNTFPSDLYSEGARNVLAISIVVIQISLYAAIASLGIRLTDRIRKNSQQKH